MLYVKEYINLVLCSTSNISIKKNFEHKRATLLKYCCMYLKKCLCILQCSLPLWASTTLEAESKCPHITDNLKGTSHGVLHQLLHLQSSQTNSITILRDLLAGFHQIVSLYIIQME